jgi:tRNA pseudouridine55 synthase
MRPHFFTGIVSFRDLDQIAQMNGILNLDKPANLSSARAVACVKRFLPRGTKIGHAGTLDPFATGVLLLLVGRATKSCEALMDQPKQYDATVCFGATTATDDPESPRVAWPKRNPNTPPPQQVEIDNILPLFTGQVLQQPPAFSALHVNGRRAYDLARQGITPVLAPRKVTIYGIEVLHYEWPELRLRIDCGRGTYIRALARDMGDALDVGGHLTQLRRTKVGKFGIHSAKSLNSISAEKLPQLLTEV